MLEPTGMSVPTDGRRTTGAPSRVRSRASSSKRSTAFSIPTRTRCGGTAATIRSRTPRYSSAYATSRSACGNSASRAARASRFSRRTVPSGRSPTGPASRSASSASPSTRRFPPEQLPHILADSGATAIFVSGEVQAAKIAEIRARVPGLRTVIAFATPPAHWRRPDARRSRGTRRGRCRLADAAAQYPPRRSRRCRTISRR